MAKGVVVATCEAHARTWLPDCLASLDGFNVAVAWSTPERNEFDVGALRVGCEVFDEFWMVPDTCAVKDSSWLSTTLAADGQSFACGPGFISCIGKIVTVDALAVGLPVWPRTKRQAVEVELSWFRRYQFATGAQVLFDEFRDGDRFEFRWGRRNMVLDCPALTKWKGTWTMEMVPD